jgi:hypothetical protein
MQRVSIKDTPKFTIAQNALRKFDKELLKRELLLR